MNKILLIAFLLLAKINQAQISDFTFDSCYSASTIGIVHYNMTSDSIIAGCANEFGFIIGDNEVITCGTRIVNMGQHDKSFQGQGVFDICHGHIHLEDMVQLYITNACGQTIAVGSKLGFNMQDGANFVQWILSGGNECDRSWLSTYGYIDPALALTAPNPDFNGSDRMGLSAGFYDTYGPQTWGNGIVTNEIGIPNGTYFMCIAGHFSQYMNQGLNIFPDTLSIPFTISGTYPPVSSSPRSIVVGGPVVMTQPSPVTNVKVSNAGVITWNDLNSPCGYEIIPYYKSGNNWNGFSGLIMTTTQKSFPYPVQALRDYAVQILHKNGNVQWVFDVKAVNGNLKSTPSRSIGQPLNVR